MARRRSRSREDDDLFRCIPTPQVGSEQDDEGKVVLLRPRFLRGPLAWWLQPRLRRPHFRVHLDELGSFVWGRCDGRHTVTQIVEDFESTFPDRAEQIRQRVRMFIIELYRGQMLKLELPATEAESETEPETEPETEAESS
jgi:hypothetical protein